MKEKLPPDIRARAYLWFARAFSYPEESRLEELNALIEGLFDYDIQDEMREWLEDLLERNIQDVEADYVTLFISGFPKTVAPPYESVYKEGLVMGASTEDVIEMYSKYQLEPAEESSLPDALPLELEFIAFLLENYSDSPDLNYFFKEHLISWVDDFIEKVETSEFPLYARLAKLLKQFIEQEKTFFSYSST